MNRREPVYDKLLVGTPFRALVVNGFAGYCAYIGVPQDHCLSNMDSVEFACHGEITFRGFGDGDLRPEGWYWFGWDYQQPGDKLTPPMGFIGSLPPELERMVERERRSGQKEWSIPEIEQDLLDAAMELWSALKEAEKAAANVVVAAKGNSHR